MMSNNPKPVAVTIGEPAGIGPDIIVKLAHQDLGHPVEIIGDRHLLADRAERLGMSIHFIASEKEPDYRPLARGQLRVRHVPLPKQPKPGLPLQANAGWILETLQLAVNGGLKGQYHAITTAPVNKSVIIDAGYHFSGHTRYLADLTDTEHVVMMLVGGGLRVALVTTHIPLAEVAQALTQPLLKKTIALVYQQLRARFGIKKPRLAVCGLNPHAGENGHMGNEERNVITPVIRELNEQNNWDITGPWPADTLFAPDRSQNYDAIVAMYHDQGLAPFKAVNFGEGVNVTLGLPIVRTSVDHGTAFELAGTGQAQATSLLRAIELASELNTANQRQE